MLFRSPTHGGISVAMLEESRTNGDAPEESVIIWYGSDAYRIRSFAQFWSYAFYKSFETALPTAMMSKIQGLTLLGEAIKSVDQFGTTINDMRAGKLRDTLVATDHRLIILTKTAQPLEDALDVARREQEEEKLAKRADETLLARGELDLGGMSRLLDRMEGDGGAQNITLGNPRRVLFASSKS